jgi:ferredoxin
VKVSIDLDKCYRSGECYYNHPELFAMGKGGEPELKLEELDADLTRTAPGLARHARQAAEVCPAAAISVED